MLERGIIHNRDRGRQIRDFSGLLFGNITPTDIDGLIEYQNKGYVIIETKLKDTPVLFGQRLALERLTDDLNKHKSSICIISRHEYDDPKIDIDVANTVVTEYRLNNKWKKPRHIYTCKELIELFIEKKFKRF